MITWPSRAWDRYRPEHPHRSRGPMRTGSLATNKSFQKRANWTTVVFCDQAWTKCPWLPWGRRKLAILVIACMEDRNSEETLQMCRAQQSGQAAGPWNCRCWSVLSTKKNHFLMTSYWNIEPAPIFTWDHFQVHDQREWCRRWWSPWGHSAPPSGSLSDRFLEKNIDFLA